MVTVNNLLGENSGTAEMELKGLSTDTKPTGEFSEYQIGENSLFIELDTGKVYYYKSGVWEAMSMSGGGAGLPAVTSEDNGKVLGVVNGAWDKTDAPEGALPAVTSADEGKVLTVEDGEWKAADLPEQPIYINDYKVTLTYNAQAGELEADKTVSDIYNAADDGMNVYAVFNLSGSTWQRFALALYSPTLVELYAVQIDEDQGVLTPKPVCIQGLHQNDADEWTIVD